MAKLAQPATIKGKLPARSSRPRDIFVFENSRAKAVTTYFVCAVPFCSFLGAKKEGKKITALNVCKQRLRIRTTGEYKSKHHIMVMDSSINRIYLK